MFILVVHTIVIICFKWLTTDRVVLAVRLVTRIREIILSRFWMVIYLALLVIRFIDHLQKVTTSNYRLIHTLCSSLQHALSLLSLLYLHRLSPGKGPQRRSFFSFHMHVFTGRRLSHNPFPGWRPSHTNFLLFSQPSEDSLMKSKSKSHATDGQSISKSYCRAPPGAHGQIFITLWQLRSCFCGAPFLTRGQVCLFYMLLVLASIVFLWSESLGTRDRILLSQIWYFPFRHLLLLAVSRWRYSTPSPHGWDSSVSCILRSAVSRPVCLGIKHPSGAYDQLFITVRQLRGCWFGALPLTRGRVCRFCWLSPAQSFCGSSPLGLATIF
jgi:hypothetical protein